MDNAQVGQELEDLEARLERLRALYEQYFLGLEKLEPTVLRKEVDRRVWVLRREQIRNTGLRFKFQMLIQRYNTYQQYWGRVVREIEAGTYRRDIIKVAQRFGEKEAMTILGKKRAEQYKRLAANQIDRRKKLKGEADHEQEGAAADRPSVEISVQEEDAPVSLSMSDLEMIEDEDHDESPTPPRGLPPVRMFGEPDMESLLVAATVGLTTWRDPQRAPAEAADPPAPAPPAEHAIAAPPPAEHAIAAPPPAEHAIAAPKPSGSAAPARSAPVKSAPAQSSAAAPSAKSRVAELAAQMRARKQPAPKPKDEGLELDRLLDTAGDPPAPAQAAAPKAATPAAAPPADKAAPSLPRFGPSSQAAKPASAQSAPVPSAPAPRSARRPSSPAMPAQQAKPASAATPSPKSARRPSSPAMPAQQPKRATVPPPPRRASAPPPAQQPKRATVPPPPQQARPAKPAADPKPDKPAPSPARSEGLSDQKMREIYAKYVGAKRAANESTAGLTFDKLAASLRAQADKLERSHPSRTIDFEVVTKDGKTALRPVVK